MISAVWYAAGVMVFALALIISIAWHEAGHLFFAKLFGVRVTQYMVGFGRTIFSRTKGETEYGVKMIPLGGYIRMIGMVPPRADGRPSLSTTAASPLGIGRQIAEQTRAADRAEILPEDAGREFYLLHPMKRIIIMFAGPAQNLIFAVVLFGIAMMAVGLPTATTTISNVSACIIPVAAGDSAQRQDCLPSDPSTPAAAAGLQPGDEIVGVNGESITEWETLQQVIAQSGDSTIRLDFIRAGETHQIDVPIVATQRPQFDATGEQVGFATIGFLGVSPTEDFEPQGPVAAVSRTGDFIVAASQAVARIPQRIPAVWDAIVNPEISNPDRPLGIIGAGRIGGEILAQDFDSNTKILWVLNLLAGFNMSLFLLNLLPILPLDGGHVLGAVIDWIRRGWSRIRRRPRPKPFDVAALMPVAYVVVLAFIGLSLLTAVADIVNPVRIFG